MDQRGKDPAPGIRRFHSEVDKMFLELLGSERVMPHTRAVFRPNADVYFDNRANAFVIKLELAGIDAREIDLELEENILRISGNRSDERHRDAVYQQMEISYGPFERRVLLPRKVDTSAATASYSGGFLEIVLPLESVPGARRIPITMKDECETQEGGVTPDGSPGEQVRHDQGGAAR